jgi:hypothetical protein
VYNADQEPPASFWQAANDDEPIGLDQLQKAALKLYIAKLNTEAKRNQEPEPEPINILRIEEILARPDPLWLVKWWLQDDSLAVLAGQSDGFKSFLALDWGLCVAAGIPWLRCGIGGNEVQQGPVVYIYAEGGSGIGKRVRAWCSKRKQEPPQDFYGIDAEVAMPDEKRVAELIKAVRGLKLAEGPKLLIIDTLAQCYGPGNENSTQDMNAFLRGCKQVKKAFPGCTVLVLHHCGWMTEHERGASNLRGALDTLIRVWEKTADDKIRVGVQKQKNFQNDPKDRGIWLQLEDVPAPKGERRQGSAVLVVAEPPSPKDVNKNDEKALASLTEAFPKGLKPAELAAASGVNQNTLTKGRNSVLKRLEFQGKVRKDDGRFFAIPVV